MTFFRYILIYHIIGDFGFVQSPGKVWPDFGGFKILGFLTLVQIGTSEGIRGFS